MVSDTEFVMYDQIVSSVVYRRALLAAQKEKFRPAPTAVGKEYTGLNVPRSKNVTSHNVDSSPDWVFGSTRTAYVGHDSLHSSNTTLKRRQKHVLDRPHGVPGVSSTPNVPTLRRSDQRSSRPVSMRSNWKTGLLCGAAIGMLLGAITLASPRQTAGAPTIDPHELDMTTPQQPAVSKKPVVPTIHTRELDMTTSRKSTMPSVPSQKPATITCPHRAVSKITHIDDADIQHGHWACLKAVSTPTKLLSTSQGAIFVAAASGVREAVLQQLIYGVKPNELDDNLYTPLHYAAQIGSVATIKLLEEYRGVNWAGCGLTPMHLAARCGRTAAVTHFVQLGGRKWHKERTVDAIATAKIKADMQHRFDDSLKEFFEERTFTAMELAVIYRHADTAVAFPRSSAGDLKSAFSLACMIGNIHMIKTLWEYSAATSDFWHNQRHFARAQVQGFPAPPLHLAVMSRSLPAVAFLVVIGAWVNATRGGSSTEFPRHNSPAHYAAMIGSLSMLELLKHYDADLTLWDYNQRTPLSYAVEKELEDVVEALCKVKHPRRGTILDSRNGPHADYLGYGHVWPMSSIKSPRIRIALWDVGVRYDDYSVANANIWVKMVQRL
jgi:ankyrin repeat protein